jgi:hypothetical protein
MSDNFDYLNIKDDDKSVLKNLSQMGEQLKKLRQQMLEDEARAEHSKKEYEHYANVIIPQEMFSAGVDSISLASGGKLSIKHNFYCQPNKNAEDRKKIVEWLRANGGGHIVEHDATVASEDFDKLSETGIPFIENTTVNTAKLKSFIKDGIGATTGVQQFTVDDIPACIHFQEVTTVDLSL